MPFRSVVSLCISFALAACLPPASGAFAVDGFHPASAPYVIHYTSPATHEVLDADWRIDNFVLGPDGAPGNAKTGAEYYGTREIDFRGKGHPARIDTFLYDLKLDNRKTGSVLWVQTIPLTRERADRNLSSLVEDYAGVLSGSGFYADVDDDGKVIRARTFATQIVDGKSVKVGDLEAYEAKIEIANVDQLTLDPDHRSGLIRVLFIRTNYMTDWGLNTYPTRAVVRVGYYARPSDFEAGLPDFDRLVQLLEFRPAPPKPAWRDRRFQ